MIMNPEDPLTEVDEAEEGGLGADAAPLGKNSGDEGVGDDCLRLFSLGCESSMLSSVTEMSSSSSSSSRSTTRSRFLSGMTAVAAALPPLLLLLLLLKWWWWWTAAAAVATAVEVSTVMFDMHLCKLVRKVTSGFTLR